MVTFDAKAPGGAGSLLIETDRYHIAENAF
jgi:hypothetical protein